MERNVSMPAVEIHQLSMPCMQITSILEADKNISLSKLNNGQRYQSRGMIKMSKFENSCDLPCLNIVLLYKLLTFFRREAYSYPKVRYFQNSTLEENWIGDYPLWVNCGVMLSDVNEQFLNISYVNMKKHVAIIKFLLSLSIADSKVIHCIYSIYDLSRNFVTMCIEQHTRRVTFLHRSFLCQWCLKFLLYSELYTISTWLKMMLFPSYRF